MLPRCLFLPIASVPIFACAACTKPAPSCDDQVAAAKSAQAASRSPSQPAEGPALAPTSSASAGLMPMPGLIDVQVHQVTVRTSPKSLEVQFIAWDLPHIGRPFSVDKSTPASTVHSPHFRIRNVSDKPIWHVQYVLFGYDDHGKQIGGPMGPQGLDLTLKVGEAKEVPLGAVVVADPPMNPELEIASVAFSDFTAEVYPPPIRAQPENWWKGDIPRPRGGYAPYQP